MYRRGSPLLIGVRSDHKLSTDHIPVVYRSCKCHFKPCLSYNFSVGFQPSSSVYFSQLPKRRAAVPSPESTRTPVCSLWMRKLLSITLPLMQGKRIPVSLQPSFSTPKYHLATLPWCHQNRNQYCASCVCDHSAVIEHTNRVIFLEDDDVAAVTEGRLSIHRIKRRAGDYPARAIQTLQMELEQIMKGELKVPKLFVPASGIDFLCTVLL